MTKNTITLTSLLPHDATELCGKCKTVKPVGEFWPSRPNICKKCAQTYYRRWKKTRQKYATARCKVKARQHKKPQKTSNCLQKFIQCLFKRK